MRRDPEYELELGSGASERHIEMAADTLGIVLPAGYRSFLREFGWARSQYLDLLGLGDDVPSELELVECVKGERRDFEPRLPLYLVAIMPDGAGNHFCLDTQKMVNSECPVVFWDHEDRRGSRQVPEVVGKTFADWLWDKLDWIESLPKQ